MNIKKLSIFIIILLTCIGGLILKDKANSQEEIYVLSEEEMTQNKSDNEIKEEENLNINNKEITVYISGAVKSPGIVTLNQGERLATAVEKVGGMTDKADLNGINMAVKLEDEMHYIIPKFGEVIESNSQHSNNTISDNSTTNKTSKININTATIEELDELPGVGEATATKILNHRDESGNFKSIEEIKNVNGIGDKKYENIKELICVN